MKLFNLCKNEWKIASRGFYFYVEIVMALIMILVLLLLVPTETKSSKEEYIFYDTTPEVVEILFQKPIEKGEMVAVADTEFKLKPVVITLRSNETGAMETVEFKDTKTISVAAYEVYDNITGKLNKMLYLMPNVEDAIRLAYAEQQIAARVYFDEQGRDYYDTYLQGSETERLKNMVYILHNESTDTLKAQLDKQTVRYIDLPELLNTRQNYIPITVILLNALMGIMIVAAYIYIDKGEGVIKAFAVTPSKVWQYLVSKLSVTILLSLISSLAITIPVMGNQPNYLLFLLIIFCSTLFGTTIGLLLGSLFDTITKAFGAILILLLGFMLPGLSYFIPGFSPLWVKLIPSYYMMSAVKDSLLVNGDTGFILLSCLGLFAGGVLLFLCANYRFKKTLTI